MGGCSLGYTLYADSQLIKEIIQRKKKRRRKKEKKETGPIHNVPFPIWVALSPI